MSELLSESAMLDLIEHEYAKKGYLFFRQVRAGTGFGGARERKIDGFAIHPYPSKKFHRIAFEVKVSRSDFARELRDHRKCVAAQIISHEFYFVMPVEIWNPLDSDKLPDNAGVITWDGVEFKQRTVRNCGPKAGPFYGVAIPGEGFWCSLLRQALSLDSENCNSRLVKDVDS